MKFGDMLDDDDDDDDDQKTNMRNWESRKVKKKEPNTSLSLSLRLPVRLAGFEDLV